MKNIAVLVDNSIKKYVRKDMPELSKNLSMTLESKLFSIDFTKNFKDAKKHFLKQYLNDIMVMSWGNISLAAKIAGKHRRQMHRILNEFDIDVSTQKKELIKPSEYLKDNIYTILEQSLISLMNDQEMERLYYNLEDVSEIISKNLDHLSFDEAKELFEKEYIEQCLKLHHNDIILTAEALQISQRTLYRKISKLGLL